MMKARKQERKLRIDVKAAITAALGVDGSTDRRK